MKTVIIFAMHLLFVSLISAQDQGNLTVTFESISNPKGELHIALFEKDSFLRKPLVSKTIKANAENKEINFENLAYGEYAVSVYQDVNENEKFDMDEYGRPSEPWVMSGNVSPMQMPIWDDAKFEFNSSTKNIVLKL